MRKHISIDAIECSDLQYVEQAQCYVCMDLFTETDVDFCMRCKFREQRRKEDAIRKGRRNG